MSPVPSIVEGALTPIDHHGLDLATSEGRAAIRAHLADPAGSAPGAPSMPVGPASTGAARYARHDGWLPEKQRAFLEAVARGLSVEQACRFVGMSVSSAYAFRNRAAGAAFALGWRAANLRARDVIADTLLARAIDGQVESTTRADGTVVSRHRFDNRLAATMLARLDRQAEGAAADHHAARLVAQDWEAFCDTLEQDDGPGRAGLFLGLRAASEADADLAAMVQLVRADRFRRTGAGLAAEVDVADLDPAQRSAWTAEQWLRAEAAGLLALAPAPADEDDAGEPPLPPLRHALRDLLDADEPADEEQELADDADFPVWEERPGCWRTSFPPPDDDFDGDETGEPGYSRDLTDAELATVLGAMEESRLERVGEGQALRDRWFRAVSDGLLNPEDVYDPEEVRARMEAAAAAPGEPWRAAEDGAAGGDAADGDPSDGAWRPRARNVSVRILG